MLDQERPLDPAASDGPPAAEQAEVDPFSDKFLPFLLCHAHHLLALHIHETAYALGLSENQYRVLALLSGGARYPLGRLAELTHTKQPTLSRVVQHMVDLGWLERQESLEDRRITLIGATPGGLAKIEPVLTEAQEHLHGVLEAFGGQSTEQLKGLLRRLIWSVTEHGRTKPAGQGD